MTPQAMAALHARVFTVPRPWSDREFADLLASPHVFALGDERGFLLGRAIAGEAEVLTLAVAPDLRRQGIARDLLQQFLTAAVARDSKTAFLEVAEGNSAAIALYLAAGFARKGRRKGYYADQTGRRLDALVMVRPLGATVAPPDGPVF